MSIARSVLWLAVGVALIVGGLVYLGTHVCNEDRDPESAACRTRASHPEAYWLGGVAVLVAIIVGGVVAGEHGKRLARMQEILTPPPPAGVPQAYLPARGPNGRPGLMLVRHPRPGSKKPYMYLTDADVRAMGFTVIAEVLYEDDETKAMHENAGSHHDGR